MTAIIPDSQVKNSEKYSIVLQERGVQKLQTFLKIAITRQEEFYIEINPEEDVIKLNSIDHSHITNTISIIDNNEGLDFEMRNLQTILQFNLKAADIDKILSLNADSEIRIVPDIDSRNNFDCIKCIISQNNVVTKEIYIPILEATNEEIQEKTPKLVNDILNAANTLVIKIDLPFLMEIIKESEIFNNERLRFNVHINGKTIERLNIETFDSDTDKTRRIKTNLFEGLHYGKVKLNNNIDEYQFNVLVSYADLKKIIVASKYYTSINLVLAEDSPICLLYGNEGDTLDPKTTLTTLLAPILVNNNEDVQTDNTN